MNRQARINAGATHRARFVLRLLSGGALICGCLMVAALQLNSKTQSTRTREPHPPLEDKSCIECHEQVVSSEVLCMATKEQMCTLCHEVPAAGGSSRLTEASEQLCLKCHTEDKFQGSYVHGPVAVGACVACHDPHGGNASELVGVAGKQMCLTCHVEMDARLSNARFQHKAVVEGCTNCHAPHASEYPFELKSVTVEFCTECHEDILQEYRKSTVKHAPVIEGSACLNCHDAHMAEDERLLLADGIDVCLKCHDGTITVDQYELAHMGQLLSENPVHHGPIQEKECSGCHKPHGSSYFRLLTDDYPKEFYTSFDKSKYDLCFRCHDSSLVTEQRTTTLTGFRDGDRNLHFVHVNKTPKGRTCRSCHETHASASPKHIRVSVPFGKWDLPVGFKKSENGGSCDSGCHTSQKYQRRIEPDR